MLSNPRLHALILAIAAVCVLVVVFVVARTEFFAFGTLDDRVTEVLANDPLEGLPDGIHILVCSANTPLPDINRSSPCIAMQVGKHLYFFDAGKEGIRNLIRSGVDVGRVDALLLTNVLSNHVDGMGELSVMRWTAASHEEPMRVHGTTSINEVVIGTSLMFGPEYDHRINRYDSSLHPSSGKGLKPETFRLDESGEVSRVIDTTDGVSIKGFRLSSDPESRAVGYRVEYGGFVVVVGNDTKASEELANYAADADILIYRPFPLALIEHLESLTTELGETQWTQYLEASKSTSATPVEIAEIAAGSNVKQLIFGHSGHDLPVGLAGVYLDGVEDVYEGKVTLAFDGEVVSLTASN